MTTWKLSDYPECKPVAARMNKNQITDVVTEAQAIIAEFDDQGSILKDLYSSENIVVYEGVVYDKDGGSKSASGRTTLTKFLNDTDTSMERGLSVTKITNTDASSDDYVLKGFEWLRSGEKAIMDKLTKELTALNCVHSALSFNQQNSLSDSTLLEATYESLEQETTKTLRRLFVGLLVANELQKENSDTQKRIQNRMMAPISAEAFADYADHKPDLGMTEDTESKEYIVSQARIDKIAKEVQEQQDRNASVRVMKRTATAQAQDNTTALTFFSIRYQLTMVLAIVVAGLVIVIGGRRSFGFSAYYTNVMLIGVAVMIFLMLFQETFILYPLVQLGLLNV